MGESAEVLKTVQTAGDPEGYKAFQAPDGLRSAKAQLM